MWPFKKRPKSPERLRRDLIWSENLRLLDEMESAESVDVLDSIILEWHQLPDFVGFSQVCRAYQIYANRKHHLRKEEWFHTNHQKNLQLIYGVTDESK